MAIYNVATQDLTVDNIKEITAQDFFTPFFSLVEHNPIDFFGKLVHELTFFQLNLLNYGRLLTSIYKNCSPPDHIKNDAAALISFAENEGKKQKRKTKRSQSSRTPPVLGRK